MFSSRLVCSCHFLCWRGLFGNGFATTWGTTRKIKIKIAICTQTPNILKVAWAGCPFTPADVPMRIFLYSESSNGWQRHCGDVTRTIWRWFKQRREPPGHKRRSSGGTDTLSISFNFSGSDLNHTYTRIPSFAVCMFWYTHATSP